MAFKVFLSHSGRDYELVRLLCANINTMGIKIYLFEHDPQPGMYIAQKIKNAISDSDCIIVLLSKAGISSNYVQQEIGYAEGIGKLVLPLVEEGIERSKLAMLEGREYVPLDRSNPSAALPVLLDFLAKKADAKAQDKLVGWAIAIVLLSILIESLQKGQ